MGTIILRRETAGLGRSRVRACVSVWPGTCCFCYDIIILLLYIILCVVVYAHTHTHTHMCIIILCGPRCVCVYIHITTTTTSARRCSSACVHVNIFGRYPAWAHIVKNEKLPVTRTAVWPVGIVCFVFVSKLVKKYT